MEDGMANSFLVPLINTKMMPHLAVVIIIRNCTRVIVTAAAIKLEHVWSRLADDNIVILLFVNAVILMLFHDVL